jgi:hypothetical protein
VEDNQARRADQRDLERRADPGGVRLAAQGRRDRAARGDRRLERVPERGGGVGRGADLGDQHRLLRRRRSTDARFSGLVTRYDHLGSDTQAADAVLIAEIANSAKWSSNCTLSGVAYTYLRSSGARRRSSGGLPNDHRRHRRAHAVRPAHGDDRVLAQPGARHPRLPDEHALRPRHRRVDDDRRHRVQHGGEHLRRGGLDPRRRHAGALHLRRHRRRRPEADRQPEGAALLVPRLPRVLGRPVQAEDRQGRDAGLASR